MAGNVFVFLTYDQMAMHVPGWQEQCRKERRLLYYSNIYSNIYMYILKDCGLPALQAPDRQAAAGRQPQAVAKERYSALIPGISGKKHYIFPPILCT